VCVSVCVFSHHERTYLHAYGVQTLHSLTMAEAYVRYTNACGRISEVVCKHTYKHAHLTSVHKNKDIHLILSYL
jgi:hypothetical protein